MFRRMTVVRGDVLEELTASIIRVTRIGELRTLPVTSNRSTLQRKLLVTANVAPSSQILPL
jgi:hypothetical protein